MLRLGFVKNIRFNSAVNRSIAISEKQKYAIANNFNRSTYEQRTYEKRRAYAYYTSVRKFSTNEEKPEDEKPDDGVDDENKLTRLQTSFINGLFDLILVISLYLK